MGRFKFVTSGESHGKCLTAIVEGMVAGLSIDEDYIVVDLKRRQGGYGRGARMTIEQDKAEILSGVRHGLTIGSPICLQIKNRDWEKWQDKMSINPVSKNMEIVTAPRPGHADLAGVVKYRSNDIRPILERASARETAARVAAGAIARRFLEEFGISIRSHTICIGNLMRSDNHEIDWCRVEKSLVRCDDQDIEKKMMNAIDRAKETGNTLGGIFEVVASGVPVGLGNHVQWRERLDGQIAQAFMSINAVKGVEIGAGFKVAILKGSENNDPFVFRQNKVMTKTNNSGGILGGISTGMPIVLRIAVKPISSIAKEQETLNIKTGKQTKLKVEGRHDPQACSRIVPVAESMVAIILADHLLRYRSYC